MTKQGYIEPLRKKISTHTLTWSVTAFKQPEIANISNFNSHAHVERDYCKDCFREILIDFNSHAHVERDREFKRSVDDHANFNSHAHVERDLSTASTKL